MFRSITYKFCFCAFMVFYSYQSYAEEDVWVYAGSNNGRQDYAAVKSRIMGAGGIDYMVRMWTKINMAQLGEVRNGSGPAMPFGSVIALDEYNCRDGESRSLKSTIYSSADGMGKVIGNMSSGEWRPVQPGTPGEKWWKMACDK